MKYLDKDLVFGGYKLIEFHRNVLKLNTLKYYNYFLIKILFCKIHTFIFNF